MTKKEIISVLKSNTKNNLEKKVLNIILNHLNEYDGSTQEKFKNIFSDYQHGCNTGVVRELIYYCDTKRWFDRYRKDIIKMLEDDIADGLFEIKYFENSKEYYPVVVLNGCNDFIRIVEYSNYIYTTKFSEELKNVLAWYSFEKILFDIINKYEEITQ